MGTPNDLVQSNLYDGVGSANEYTLIPGVCVLPLAEDPPTSLGLLATYSPVVLAQLHAPYRIRKYTSAAQKQNGPPVVQTPQSSGAFVFLGGSVSFYSQFNTTWWNADWTVSSEYFFVENCVSRPQDGFVLGSVTPFTNDPDLAAATQFGSSGGQSQITIGAISGAGLNAQAGFIYGQEIAGLPASSQPTGTTGNSQLTLGIVPQWSYTMTSFYPGTLFNDQLMNGGGV